MFYNLIRTAQVTTQVTLNPSYSKLASKQVAKNGVMSRSFVFERCNNAEILGKFNVNDFKLQNILALGAYDVLKPVTITDCNPLTVIDNVESVVNVQLNPKKTVEK